MITPFWIDPNDPATFPDVEFALRDPEGLLAVGGDLSPERLIAAYAKGIFPWFSAGQPILWWSPNPRLVLFPEEVKISRSLRKSLRKNPFEVRFDHAFNEVVRRCAEPRPQQDGTWITREMKAAYARLFDLGLAHSAEAWEGDELVGGLYGVALGRVFFGESMFSRRTDASKIAFVHLVRHLQAWGYHVIDCQVKTDHLMSLGAVEIPRRRFTQLLARHVVTGGRSAPWRAEAMEF